jgi:hypothetical protein
MPKLKSSQSSGHTHIYQTSQKCLSTCCFLGQEGSADGGTQATRDHNNVKNVLQNTIETDMAIENKMCFPLLVLFTAH